MLSPLAKGQITYSLGQIESLINSNDYTGAAVCYVAEEMTGPLNLFGNDDSATVGSLDIEIPTLDTNGGDLPILI